MHGRSLDEVRVPRSLNVTEVELEIARAGSEVRRGS